MFRRNTVSFKRRWTIVTVLVALGVAAASALIWNATATTRSEIDLLAKSNADQRVWQFVEIESNVHQLHYSLLNHHAPYDAHMAHVREEFAAVLKSVEIVCEDPSFAELKNSPSIGDSLNQTVETLAKLEPLVRADFSTDAVLLKNLTDLAFELTDSVEQLNSASLPAFAEVSKIHQERVAKALLELGLIIVILFFVLLVSLIILLYSLRIGAIRTTEIIATRNRLNAMISTSQDGVLMVDADGKILDYNGAASRIFGYSRAEAIGQELAELIIPQHLRDAHHAGMKRYLSTGNKRVVDQGLVELEACDKSGRIFPVELSIASVESEKGEIFVSFIRDISDRVAKEAELVDARDKAVSGEKAKAKMLAVMSHEMRTPLNGLLGSLQLLSKTKLNSRQLNFVDVMTTSGHMLLEHVNNVLDISRVDAGKVERTYQAFDLKEAVNDVVSSLQEQAKERGNVLSVDFVGSDVAGAIGDKTRLTQILVNLAGNAIKFTEDGAISIEVERNIGEDTVEFRVVDSGIGISERDVKNIFEDFVTLDTSFRREVEGTGLGLSIVKRLVTLLSGQIGVESVVGEGSVFWVRLPLPEANIDAESVPEPLENTSNSTTNCSILLVEDNEINRLVAREMLASFGCETTEAIDGLEGVERAQEQKFDLILCDISMPRLDGIEATKRIRYGNGPNANSPIVALTAHALPDDIARFHAAGMNDVVVKPLTFEEVDRVLSDHIGDRDSTRSDASTRAELSSLLGDDRMKDLLKRVHAELQDGIERLLIMVAESEDNQAIKGMAHKLAGVAAVAGFSRLHAQLSSIENAVLNSSTSELEMKILEARTLLATA